MKCLVEEVMYRTNQTWRFLFAAVAIGQLNCLAGEPQTAPAPSASRVTAGPSAAVSDTMAAKKEILASPAWQLAMQGVNEWLSNQLVYDQDQAAQLMAQLSDKVDKMSAVQLQDFLQDLQLKLKIVRSPQAAEARAWAEDHLSKYTPAAAAKFRSTLPDVTKMSAAQLQQVLSQNLQRRNSEAASQQAFDQMRAKQVSAYH